MSTVTTGTVLALPDSNIVLVTSDGRLLGTERTITVVELGSYVPVGGPKVVSYS